MALPKTPYDNKKHYDSGRLRHKVSFIQDIATPNGSGGTTLSESLLLETFAGKEEPSQYTQNGLNQGRSEYNQYQYFIIRNRQGFKPEKDMRLVHGTDKYIIQRVTELDDPCTFLKLLCAVSL